MTLMARPLMTTTRKTELKATQKMKITIINDYFLDEIHSLYVALS